SKGTVTEFTDAPCVSGCLGSALCFVMKAKIKTAAKRLWVRLILLATLSSLTGAFAATSEQVRQPTVTLPAPLARVLAEYEAAWQRKDATALAALFAEDGFVLSNESPPVRGREQIARHYAGAGGALALRPFAFATNGSIGYIIGGFARQKGEPDTGK